MAKPDKARKVYNHFAPFYDTVMRLVEGHRLEQWRSLMWSKAAGPDILEVGVGTGRNFPYYPKGSEVTAIELSEKMLERARAKATRQGVNVKLELMDVQDLKFEDNTFDSVLASLVFCSVPDPVLGLKEIKRVCKPGAMVLLLEHGLSDNRFLAVIMHLFNPLTSWIGGEHINRRIVENVIKSGLTVEKVTSIAGGIVKLVEARK